MKINTDINILGGISDLNIISNLLNTDKNKLVERANVFSDTKIKTKKSLKRYESAVTNTLIYFSNKEIKELFETVFAKNGLSEDSLALLFLNASFNNELLDYLNQNIYFPAYFSGRIAIKKDEVIACINDLKQKEETLKKWSDSTVEVTASKYLSLLHKFNLLEGGRNKSIQHKYIDDRKLIIFLYWLLKIESKPNILASKWLQYCFLDLETLTKRILEKKFMKYINVVYTGDTMKLETQFSYKDIYNELAKA